MVDAILHTQVQSVTCVPTSNFSEMDSPQITWKIKISQSFHSKFSDKSLMDRVGPQRSRECSATGSDTETTQAAWQCSARPRLHSEIFKGPCGAGVHSLEGACLSLYSLQSLQLFMGKKAPDCAQDLLLASCSGTI